MRHLLSGFYGGEIDPMMKGRVDTENYAFGLDTCENFIALAQGPLVKRGGFEFIRDADPTSTWLLPFRFSATQEYVLECGAGKLRFFTNGGRIETAPNVAYELAVPYGAAEAPALSIQQSFDRLYIDHPAHPPAALARTGAVTFSYAASQLLNGPFNDDNSDEAVTVTASGTSGSGITLTASSPIFAGGNIGALFRLQAKDFSTIKAWEPGMTGVMIGDVVRSDGKAYTALTGGTTGSVQPTHSEGSAWDGQLRNDLLNSKGPWGVQWAYKHDKFGIVTITGFGGGGTTATADVVRRLPDSCTSVASFRWAHHAFSAAEGWPSLVVHWAGRQVHFKDFDLVASVAGDFGGGRVNFAAYTASGIPEPDLSFRRTLATEDPPLWVAGDRKLLVGTAGKELAVGAINSQAAISGSNISADPQSFYGSEAVRPLQVGVQTIFIERGGRRVRASGYDFARDRYAADDITVAARQVTASGIVQLAYQRNPWPVLHLVRGDGQIAVHCDSKGDVKGFSRVVLGGGARALSAVSVTGADGKTDELWLLVSRDTPGGTRREIWRQSGSRELGDARDECFFVDGGARAAAAAGQTHFSGLTHLADQAVAVLANGAVVPGMTVNASGELDLPATAVPQDHAWVLVVGLPYTATAITLPPEFKIRIGTIQGLKKRVRKLVLRLLETVGIRAGQSGQLLDELIDRPGSAAMDAPIPFFTGDTEGLVETAFDRNGQVSWISDVPLPAVVTAAMLSMEVDERDA